MTEKAKAKFTVSLSLVLTILAICGYVWSAATQTQSVKDSCETNASDIKRVEQTVLHGLDRIEARQIIIDSDIKQLLRNSR